MPRKLRLTAVLLLLTLSCTGCLQLTADVVIKHDQDIAVTVYSGSANNPEDSPTKDSPCQDPHFVDALAEPYAVGGYNGCRYSYTLSAGRQHASGMLIKRTGDV